MKAWETVTPGWRRSVAGAFVALVVLLPGAASAASGGASSTASSTSAAGTTVEGVPSPPTLAALQAASLEVMDERTGQVLDAVNPNLEMEPASLVKMMTFLLTVKAMQSGNVSASTMIPISRTAQLQSTVRGTSEMYIDGISPISLSNLLKGLMVSSGNDAAIALADYFGGTQTEFVSEMNQEAQKLGMSHTVFVNPDGLTAPGQYSSAGDMAILARAIWQTDPSYSDYTALPSFTWDHITAYNYNKLIGVDSYVNGMKSGYLTSADLVATGTDGNDQMIAVVMGVTGVTEGAALNRAAQDDELLLDWAFANFHDVPAPWNKAVPSEVRLWEGRTTTEKLLVDGTNWVTETGSSATTPTLKVSITNPLVAPLTKGEPVGTVKALVDGKVVGTATITAAASVPRGGFLHVLWDKLYLALDGHPRQTVTS